MLGAFLYSLTARDEQAALIDAVLGNRLVTIANASFSVAYQVPSGRAMLLKSFVARSTGTGGQLINTQMVRIQRLDQSAMIALNAFISGGPADAVLQSSALSDLVLMPGDILEAQTTFTAGVAVNTISLDFTGVLIPRGTLGYGSLIQL